jgi:hypothetical protein
MHFEEFQEPFIPSYAILSHTWHSGELSYNDFNAISWLSFNSFWNPSEGLQKLRGFAAQTRRRSIDYIWIDTCKFARHDNYTVVSTFTT